MCLGIPHQVVEVLDADSCLIRLGAATQPCFVGLIDDLKVGDWVVVHAGFAIDRIAPEDAAANLELIAQYLEPPAPPSAAEGATATPSEPGPRA
jgi:hydrogenase expression/formation protein HypC